MSKKIKVVQPEWVRQQMAERIFAREDEAHTLAQALYRRATCFPQQVKAAQQQVMISMERACSMPVCRIKTWSDLTRSRIFSDALLLLFGHGEAGELMELLRLRSRGAVAETIFRTPFHSAYMGDYVEGIFLPVIYRWICGTGCPVTVLDCLTQADLSFPEEYDLSNRLALELYRGAEDVHRAVNELLQQEDEEQRPAISREILRGMILSGDEESVAHVKALLLDRSMPPKLRSDLLSFLDLGDAKVFAEFLQLIYNERLYRMPAVARMVDSWFWLGFGTLEPELAQMVLEESLALIHRPQLREAAVLSDDAMTVHLVLWTTALEDVRRIRPLLQTMLRSHQKQQVISAAYFINHLEHRYLDYKMTVELLGETEDPELLAWLIPNLIPQDLEERMTDCTQERQKQFSLMERLLKQIGKEETTFMGKPFPWTTKRLWPEPVVECMLRMAACCGDRSMVRSLGRLLDYFTPKQRGFYYEYVLNPQRWSEDAAFLRVHRKDRSPKNRQLIQQRLAQVGR